MHHPSDEINIKVIKLNSLFVYRSIFVFLFLFLSSSSFELKAEESSEKSESSAEKVEADGFTSEESSSDVEAEKKNDEEKEGKLEKKEEEGASEKETPTSASDELLNDMKSVDNAAKENISQSDSDSSASVEAEVSTEVVKKKPWDIRNFNYYVETALGQGTFLSENNNPTVLHELDIIYGYSLNDTERLGLILVWTGELFTQPDGGQKDYVYFADPIFSFSSSRVPNIKLNEDYTISNSAAFSLRPGLSMASRNVSRRFLATTAAVTSSISLGRVSLAYRPLVRYHFNRYNVLKSPTGAESYDGALNTQFSYQGLVSVGTSIVDKLSFGLTFIHYHNLTEENNIGEQNWNNSTYTQLALSYGLHKNLSVSVGAKTFQSLYTNDNQVRFPFWAIDKDYYNRTSVYLGLSGNFN